jgi:hypothetical protein
MMIFNGRVDVKMSIQTLGTDESSLSLSRSINEALPLKGNEFLAQRVSGFSVLMSCTESMTFNLQDGDHPAFLAWKTLWEQRETLSPLDLWNGRRCLPNQFIDEWWKVFADAQQLFKVDPGQKSETVMTEEEKAELAKSDSPLDSRSGVLVSAS